MSTSPGANLDLVRRIYDEFNETLELPRWALRDDVTWQPPSDEPDNALRSGADAVTAYVREWASIFDDYHCEVHELIDRGERVLAALHLGGRIGESGAPMTIPVTQVWTIRDGKVARVDEYRSTDEALRAH
ncbi:MAG TPA: nuclear transport factor 2 family protein [Thermoleophilaceae bacterium]|nr:nuclear transport factor 2 family protein [Thermoleophilaceae bacterium]